MQDQKLSVYVFTRFTGLCCVPWILGNTLSALNRILLALMLPHFYYPNMSTFHLTSKDESLLWSCSEDVWGCRFLLYRAALSVGIFGAQTQFRFVVFQVKQLLGVERSTSLPGNMKETFSHDRKTMFINRTDVWAITGTVLNMVHEKTEQLLGQ